MFIQGTIVQMCTRISLPTRQKNAKTSLSQLVPIYVQQYLLRSCIIQYYCVRRPLTWEYNTRFDVPIIFSSVQARNFYNEDRRVLCTVFTEHYFMRVQLTYTMFSVTRSPRTRFSTFGERPRRNEQVDFALCVHTSIIIYTLYYTCMYYVYASERSTRYFHGYKSDRRRRV